MTITFPKPEGWVPPPPALPPSAYEGPPVGRQGQKFVPNPRRGYTSLRVLPFLEGKPWDWIALSYVQALRPSTLRVTRGSMQLNTDLWRVTVDLQQDGKTIRSIEQEVEVGLPEGVPHGHGLGVALKLGMDSKELEWENIRGTAAYLKSGIFKYGDDGKNYPHPSNP